MLMAQCLQWMQLKAVLREYLNPQSKQIKTYAAATTGLEGVGTATESAAAGADSLATSLDNIAASAQEAETNISRSR